MDPQDQPPLILQDYVDRIDERYPHAAYYFQDVRPILGQLAMLSWEVGTTPKVVKPGEWENVPNVVEGIRDELASLPYDYDAVMDFWIKKIRPNSQPEFEKEVVDGFGTYMGFIFEQVNTANLLLSWIALIEPELKSGNVDEAKYFLESAFEHKNMLTEYGGCWKWLTDEDSPRLRAVCKVCGVKAMDDPAIERKLPHLSTLIARAHDIMDTVIPKAEEAFKSFMNAPAEYCRAIEERSQRSVT